MSEALARGFADRLNHDPAAQAYLCSRLAEGAAGPLAAGFALGVSGSNLGLFSDRLTFPVWGINGDVVQFRGRTFRFGDHRPKTVPWPGQPSSHPFPFGVSPASYTVLERLRFAVLVEGEFDCLALWSAGVPAVACSTSYLTDAKAQALAEVVDCVAIWPDNDSAGAVGRDKMVAALSRLGVDTVTVRTPVASCKDPNDVLLVGGVEAVRRAVSNAVGLAASATGWIAEVLS